MPVEDAVEANFVLALQVLVDDNVFEEVLAVGDKEVAQEYGEGRNEEEDVLRDDCAIEY
jgi:hypothetical protein